MRCRLVLPYWLPLPLTGFPAPYSPDPLPRRGRGRFIVILCKGLRPLHPRGLNPGGTGGRGRTTCSVGDVLSLSPVATAFRLLFCPLFPRPRSQSALPPAGKGEIYSYLMQGAPPLASPGLEPGRHWGQGANYVLGGRCAFLVSGCHCLPLAFLPPIPPPALAERSSPSGEGGDL